MYALSVQDLRKVYGKNLLALNNVSMNVAEGDFFALLGPNGAGKSTTIGILCSLVNKTSGRVNVFNYDLDVDVEGAKSCIGVVPQEMNFNPFERVIDIITNQAGYYGIPRKVAIPRAQHYLKKMGILDKQNQPAIRLSGGMKRRLMIARALINEPKLLILDEPTAGVDIELRYELWEFLAELNQNGTTIILTTHYLEEAERLCKTVAIIDHGEIIEHSPVKALINRLNAQTIIVDLETPINNVPLLNDYTSRLIDNTSMEVEIRKDQSLNDLFAQLNQHAITVTSMRNKTNRLEELFVRLIAENKKST